MKCAFMRVRLQRRQHGGTAVAERKLYLLKPLYHFTEQYPNPNKEGEGVQGWREQLKF